MFVNPNKLLLAVLLSPLEALSSTSFTALLDAGGVSGYFQMSLADGSGKYSWDINLSTFPTTCNVTDGLTC